MIVIHQEMITRVMCDLGEYMALPLAMIDNWIDSVHS
jgi:hypothetical protein